MRHFNNFKVALNELRREASELGTFVHPQTMQDKFVGDNPDYVTKEFTNEFYMVTSPWVGDLNPTQPWADAEFEERVNFVTDGVAWKLRPDVWTEFHDRGFGYTYGERYATSLDEIAAEVGAHPDSRQLFLSVWNPARDARVLGQERVPCSLGYWFFNRGGRLGITYLQRSSDLVTHLENDVYLSHRLQLYVAERAGLRVGPFCHWIGSLHAYAKDVAGSF